MYICLNYAIYSSHMLSRRLDVHVLLIKTTYLQSTVVQFVHPQID